MASKIIVDQLEKTGGALTALTLPVANATANQYIKNDGAGALSWATLPGGGKIGQVVSTTLLTGTFTSTSTTYTDITGLTVAITPSAVSSKVLVFATFNVSNSADDKWAAYQLVRDSTAISIGDAASSRTRASAGAIRLTATGSNNQVIALSLNYLDSPSTTSSTTYKIQGKAQSGVTFAVNRSGTDADADYSVRTASTITVMEVLA